MATTAPRESRSTTAVFRNLQKNTESSLWEPIGSTFGGDRQEFEQAAKAYLGEHSRLGTATIDGADWDAVFAYFAPAAQETPAKPGRRASLGAAAVPGWELLYDKPRQAAQVARRDGTYALICTTHGTVRRLDRLAQERELRKAGGWCSKCGH